ELLPIPIGTRDRGDRASVIEEGVGIADFRLETELVRDFGKPIPIIVDQDLIEDIIAELKEVGAAGWLLQRDIVADQGDRVWSVRADKGVGIGIISHRIFRNFGRFAMG